MHVAVMARGFDDDLSVAEQQMQALGQKQTFEGTSRMSALPPKADIWETRLSVLTTSSHLLLLALDLMPHGIDL